MEDGENTFGEFKLGAVIRAVENQDLAPVLLGHLLDEFKAEPVESGLGGQPQSGAYRRGGVVPVGK